jgi:hypothetical protein
MPRVLRTEMAKTMQEAIPLATRTDFLKRMASEYYSQEAS